MKDKFRKIRDKVILFLLKWFLILLPVICVAVSLFVAYKISVSDLPGWLKFWLLK